MGCASSGGDDALGQKVFDAATKGDLPGVQQALKGNPQIVNWGGKHGENYTPLMSACWNRHGQVAAELIKQGARVNEQNTQFGSTALHIAAFHGLKDVVVELLACEADFELQDKTGKTALDNAQTRKHPDIVKILQQKRNEMMGFDEAAGKSLLAVTRKQGLDAEQEIKEAKKALDDGADPNYFEGDSKYTPLMQALWNGREELACFLMDRGADLDMANKRFGSTPMHIACGKGLVKAVQMLIDKGANTKASNLQGKMPIEDARANGRQNIVDMLGGTRTSRGKTNNLTGEVTATDMLPDHWTTQIDDFPAQRWMAVWLDEGSPIFQSLQGVLATDGSQLGKGRDVVEQGDYRKLVLKHAWRIENLNLWKRYEAERDVVAGEAKQIEGQSFPLPQLELRKEFADHVLKLPSDTTADPLTVSAINEKFLLHGMKPETVLTILQNGCNARFSKGNFGAGTYLAEDAGKADQYVTRDTGEDPALEELHTRLYRKDGKPVEHPGTVYYVMLVRNMMGYFVRTLSGAGDAVDMDWSAPVYATPEKRELATIPSVTPPIHYHSLFVELGAAVKRYREIVQFHENRIYPEYLLAYQRS